MQSRRRALAVLAASSLAAPRVLLAQSRAPAARIGYLHIQAIEDKPTPERAAFLGGLRERGYEPGRNLAIEYRGADGELARLPELARPVPVGETADLERALAALAQVRPDAILIIVDARMVRLRKIIVDAALKVRVPCVAGWRGYVESGALASYAPDFRALFHRAAYYVDRLLKGAKPQDMPIERPSKFELLVNARTAAALGIAVPKALLLRADEVIR